MIITSSQQIQDILNPSEQLNMVEFEMITMVFASYICIIKNKKLNYLNFLKILVEDKKIQQIYCKALGDDCFQNVVKTYLNSTPNVYKKIFRSKFNKSIKCK
jgi:hypothetical protein